MAERDLYNAVGPYLDDRSNSARLEVLPQSSDEGRGCRCGHTGKGCQVASKPGVNEELLPGSWFCAFEQDSRGEVVKEKRCFILMRAVVQKFLVSRPLVCRWKF